MHVNLGEKLSFYNPCLLLLHVLQWTSAQGIPSDPGSRISPRAVLPVLQTKGKLSLEGKEGGWMLSLISEQWQH